MSWSSVLNLKLCSVFVRAGGHLNKYIIAPGFSCNPTDFEVSGGGRISLCVWDLWLLVALVLYVCLCVCVGGWGALLENIDAGKWV